MLDRDEVLEVPRWVLDALGASTFVLRKVLLKRTNDPEADLSCYGHDDQSIWEALKVAAPIVKPELKPAFEMLESLRKNMQEIK